MLSKLFIHNFLKILIVNFRFLPFKQAIHLPIDVYGKLRILSYKGNIKIESEILRPGMIKLGSQGRDMFPNDAVILDVRGTLVFKGPFYIGCGSTLRVEEGATLTIGAKSRIGACSVVFCESGITIGNLVEISWKSQIMDTDRHEMQDTVTGKIYPSRAPITIGDSVWIGNNVLINKGCKIASNTIVASCSLCNKNYGDLPPYSVIGGIPAKQIASNKARIWEE